MSSEVKPAATGYLTRRSRITFRDVLESVRVVNKFLSFSQRLSKFFTALAQAGVDVSKINPYNFEDMIKMAASLRNQGVSIDFGDLDELYDEFNDILDMDIFEMKKHAEIIRRYSSMLGSILKSVKIASKSMPKDSSEINAMMGMFGFGGAQPPALSPAPVHAGNTSLTDETEFDEDDYESELTEEDISEFKSVIEQYRRSSSR